MGKEKILFEHFDRDLDIGNIDEHGNLIRPRKKPGRKPNPPSPAQRKAQNRTAQRAFRERKRQEIKEAEQTIEFYKQERDRAYQHIKILQRRIEELQYETNYLKGFTLSLKLVCVANQVELPKFWDTGVTDEIGADEMSFSKSKGIPQQLELFLDSDLNIISMIEPEALSVTKPNPLFSIAPQLANHLETSFLQKIVSTDLMNQFSIHPEPNPPDTHFTFSVSTPNDISSQSEHDLSQSPPSTSPSHTESTTTTLSESISEDSIDPKTGNIRQVSLPNRKKVVENHTLLMLQKKQKFIYPPMTPLEAIPEMRAIKNLDENTRVLFTPTELQRSVRHDTRIDTIPSAAFRDHMILFQDFYNANELFNYLADHAVFLGGELGNIDAWCVPPQFLRKYWFLCPNHKHKRDDNMAPIMVEYTKQMMEWMNQRKKMYLEREKYADYFPKPIVKKNKETELENLFKEQDQQYLDSILQLNEDHINSNSDSEPHNLSSSDLNLDQFMLNNQC